MKSHPTSKKFCDIHMHVIPGVDDGSTDMDMSLMMLLSDWDQGTEAVFATSHSSAYDADPELVHRRFQELQAQAGRYLKGLKLYLGCEVYCEASRMEDVLKSLESGRYPTMNGTDYVLMEFSQWVQPDGTLPCVKALADAGWKPIIAHMERYRYLNNRMDLVEQFQKLGALLQVNAYSLMEESDPETRLWAQKLVLEKKISFLGTDAHRTYHRPPSAESGLTWLYQHMDREYADAVTWGNARILMMA